MESEICADYRFRLRVLTDWRPYEWFDWFGNHNLNKISWCGEETHNHRYADSPPPHI
jgi:hypothetical protein